MTREQEFERQLSEWLASGPTTVPTATVEGALERTQGRRQRARLWRWLSGPSEAFAVSGGARRATRLGVLALVLTAVLLTSFVITVPLGGGPGPAPAMDPTEPYPVSGIAHLSETIATPARLTRTLEIAVEDPRIDGRAVQRLEASFDGAGVYHYHGTMRLENAWGAWEGPVDIARYPDGEEVEMAALTGTGAYEGHTYHYTHRHQPAVAERTVEGAIWPDEPPPLPDPSQLP